MHWQLLCSGFDAAEQGWQLFEKGALGIEELDDGRFRVFLSGAETAAQEFASSVREAGGTVERIEQLPEENWVARCSELLQPVRAGKLVIEPVLSADVSAEAALLNELSIRVIPGQGFGTGHHPSTRQALLLLQHPSVGLKSSDVILDFGTGSGILALAAVRLYGCRSDAVDISESALQNTADNVTLNSAGSRITIRRGGIEQIKRKYRLIMANMYCELLTEFEPVFRDHTGQLIVAGVLEELVPALLEKYEPEWEVVCSSSSEGWTAFLFRRR